MVQREIEQIYMQMNKTRKELSSLEGRLEGLTSTLRQMILNEQLVCRKIKYTKSPINQNATKYKSCKFRCLNSIARMQSTEKQLKKMLDRTFPPLAIQR